MCRPAGWSTGFARPPEAKCRRDGWSTGRARPPEAKCRRASWSTRPSGEERENTRATPNTQLRASRGRRKARSEDGRWLASQRTARPLQRSNYELFNCFLTATLIYTIGAGITAAAGTRPSNGSSRKDLNWTHSNYRASKESCIILSLPPRLGSG